MTFQERYNYVEKNLLRDRKEGIAGRRKGKVVGWGKMLVAKVIALLLRFSSEVNL